MDFWVKWTDPAVLTGVGGGYIFTIFAWWQAIQKVDKNDKLHREDIKALIQTQKDELVTINNEHREELKWERDENRRLVEEIVKSHKETTAEVLKHAKAMEDLSEGRFQMLFSEFLIAKGAKDELER